MSWNGYDIVNGFYWRRSVTGRLTFSLQLYLKSWFLVKIYKIEKSKYGTLNYQLWIFDNSSI